ncbi:MAG: hypothetical protein KKG76_05410 [Euryarchaeota archaeon]|nr:hypothetical protein [Euryarchaeota archaeon]MBU4139103.1 hypothetical protein [Euryarchaeota archaeon]
MVTIDPCERLKIIQKQLIPSIISSASLEIDTLDIKAAIEKNLPDLEKQCYELADRCEKKFPGCSTEIELCNREKIKETFQETREKIEKIWLEKEKSEVEGEG